MVWPNRYDAWWIRESIFEQEEFGELPVTRRILPLIIFFVLMGFLAQSLYQSDTELPSPLIGKSIPEFKLTNLINGEFVTRDETIGSVCLINVWATWCV